MWHRFRRGCSLVRRPAVRLDVVRCLEGTPAFGSSAPGHAVGVLAGFLPSQHTRASHCQAGGLRLGCGPVAHGQGRRAARRGNAAVFGCRRCARCGAGGLPVSLSRCSGVCLRSQWSRGAAAAPRRRFRSPLGGMGLPGVLPSFGPYRRS
eukprot:11445349-Alexandrium_andersonii.AAC.1